MKFNITFTYKALTVFLWNLYVEHTMEVNNKSFRLVLRWRNKSRELIPVAVLLLYECSSLNGIGAKRARISRKWHKKKPKRTSRSTERGLNTYSQNTNLLPPKPKSTFRHLKQGIQDFHRKYVLAVPDHCLSFYFGSSRQGRKQCCCCLTVTLY